MTYGARYFSAVKDDCYGLEEPDPECNLPDFSAPWTQGSVTPCIVALEHLP